MRIQAWATAMLLCVASACRGHRNSHAMLEVDSPAFEAVSAPSENAVSGLLEAPDGSPAAGAVVVLNQLDGKRAVTKTDVIGHFGFSLPAKRYALTATSPRGRALFVPPVDPSPNRTPVGLRLGDPGSGFQISGTV